MSRGSGNTSVSMTRSDDQLPPFDRERPVGLLAGAGRFPVAFAEKARHIGLPLVTVGLRGHAPAELAQLSDRFDWAGVAKIGRMIRLFKREGVRDWVMAGKVQKTRLIGTPWRVLRLLPDRRALHLWYRRVRDHADD